LRKFWEIGRIFRIDTYGALAIANLLICAISGVFLAIPYDVSRPFESLSLMMIFNPGGAFFRNAHYWSAQFFLVFTLLHTWDFLKDEKSKKIKNGLWFRLILSLLFVFYVMISGFILKADTDSLQARRIIDALISGIPFAGNLLSYSLLGPEGTFQLIYVHHIATATIFLFIIILEHAKTIWTKIGTFLWTVTFVAIISFFFAAPLNTNPNPVLKGPWYFVGLQEILFWMSHPAWILAVIGIFLTLIFYLPKFDEKIAALAKRFILYSFFIYFGLTIIAWFFRGENWKWNWKVHETSFPVRFAPIPLTAYPDSFFTNLQTSGAKTEGCLACHFGMTGFSPSHNPVALGCAACHLGDPLTLNKNQAHRKMIKIPGNIENTTATCGTTGCHPEIASRIQTTLMTTMSGVVSVDRFVFNETETPGQLSHIKNIGHSPADQHLRDMCANCHLGNPKTEYGPINQESRGGGCNACHLNYDKDALAELQKSNGKIIENADMKFHPELSLKISNNHCFGCHSRSGRISTNYEGWHETQLKEKDITDWKNFRKLEDERIFEFVSDDVHHQKGMDCIDCHTSYETMGDGNLYTHEELQTQVKCEDCHFYGAAQTIAASEFDQETYKILQLRKYPNNRRFLEIEKSGKALVNTFLDNDGKPWLLTKNRGDTLPLLPTNEICRKGKAHDELSCEACHSAWAPQCIGCHNAFDENIAGYDLLDYRDKKGSWVEYTSRFLADPPALGVDERSEIASPAKRKVGIYIPGMILSIDLASFGEDFKDRKEIFHRFYAPTSPHTTSAKGRSCKSCHNDPLALGYGRGKLEFVTEGNVGKWNFNPRYTPNKNDGLPEDAWTGFLQERVGFSATRDSVRPFNIDEQKQILTVGACLTCHEERAEMMLQGLDDFKEVLNRISRKCVVPVWE